MKFSIKKSLKKYIKKQFENNILSKKIKYVLFADDFKVLKKKDDFQTKSGGNSAVLDELDDLEMPVVEGLEGSRFFLATTMEKQAPYRSTNVINIVQEIGLSKFDLSGMTKMSDKINIFKNYIKDVSKNKILIKSYSELAQDLNQSKSQVETLVKRCIKLGLLEKISRGNYKIKFKD